MRGMLHLAASVVLVLSLQTAASAEGQACTAHCDCPQTEFCYYGKCVLDPKFKVYCCDKPGCPPGIWCVGSTGTKAMCGPDPSYTCKSACDCGPAHCCKNGQCIKDTSDPLKPGGVSGSCQVGTDATYCCATPVCHAGRLAYKSAGKLPLFRCFRKDSGATAQTCGGKTCFSSCDCSPGESCVDTDSDTTVVPGKLCSREGGHCVSQAVAESVYGYSPSDLLPCCGSGCPNGQACEAGWRSDGRYPYVRVVGTCGSCGNGKCDSGESPSTCSQDCSCGDAKCDPEEVTSCAADCGICGDGVCHPWESPMTCSADCASMVCGDGSCQVGEICALDCPCADSALWTGAYRVCGDGHCHEPKCCIDPETCENCVQDCGSCPATPELLACSASLRDAMLHYVGKYVSALQRCYGAVNRGSAVPPCPDLKALEKIQRASDRVDPEDVVESCPAGVAAELVREEPECGDVQSGLSLVDCGIGLVTVLADAMLALEHAAPDQTLDDLAVRRCQAVIARMMARRYALPRLKRLSACLDRYAAGRVPGCPDPETEADTALRAAGVEARIRAACTDETVARLSETGGFGGACAGVATVDDLVRCQIDGHREAADEMLARLGTVPIATPTPAPSPTPTPAPSPTPTPAPSPTPTPAPACGETSPACDGECPPGTTCGPGEAIGSCICSATGGDPP